MQTVLSSDLASMLNIMDVIDRIARLPDDASLTTDEAALYLRKSISSMERMRKNGSGPRYVQGGGPESKRSNQKVTYKLGELRRWQSDHEVSHSMEAAVMRGMALGQLADSSIKLPFWIHDQTIFGCVYDDSSDQYLEHRQIWKIRWMSTTDAIHAKWGDQDREEKLKSAYQAMLERELWVVCGLRRSDYSED